MIDGLKPYPRMKDSGVQWIGKVPAHWTIRRLRSVAEIRVSSIDKHTKEDEQPVRLCNYVDVYKNERITDRIPFMRATALPEEVERYRLQIGDVLITKDSEAWNDIGVPSLVEYAAPDLVSGYHLALLRANRGVLSGAFLHRALQARPIAYQLHVAANGVTRYGLPHEAIKSLLVPCPPLDEQAAIVRFLDHVGRRIRQYIRAKKQLIALLNEQRHSVIHRAVTRGLDASIRLKPSSVASFGELPAHWAALQLRRFVSFVTSGSRSWADYYSDDGEIFVQSGNLGRSMSLDFSYTQYVRPPQGAEGERTNVQTDDILICITGALTGNVVIVDLELPRRAYVNQHVALVRVKPGSISPRFVAYALHSELGQSQFKNSEYGGTKQGLGLDDIKSAWVPVPPLEEQRRICAHLDDKLQMIASASDATEREMTLMRAYWTRLVSDAVTGKMDVRDATRRLPEQPRDVEREDAEDAEPVEGIEDLREPVAKEADA